MALAIKRGRRPRPKKVVLYGVEGIGKTTLASQWPDAVILDTEDGSGDLDVAAIECFPTPDDPAPVWQKLKGAILELCRDRGGFRTVVIDSIDWAERSIIEQMLSQDGKKSIEEYGFGKGYVQAAERMAAFLALCDKLVAAGLHVVLVAHAIVRRSSPPDMADGFDRYELKLTKQSSPIVKEWSDAILFANYQTKLVEGGDGRKKAVGGKDRVIHCEHAAAWDAKNRVNLPERVPMAIEHLAPLIAGVLPPARPAAGGWLARVAEAQTVEALGEIGDAADQALSDGQITDPQHRKLRKAIDERHGELEPQEVT